MGGQRDGNPLDLKRSRRVRQGPLVTISIAIIIAVVVVAAILHDYDVDLKIWDALVFGISRHN